MPFTWRRRHAIIPRHYTSLRVAALYDYAAITPPMLLSLTPRLTPPPAITPPPRRRYAISPFDTTPCSRQYGYKDTPHDAAYAAFDITPSADAYITLMPLTLPIVEFRTCHMSDMASHYYATLSAITPLHATLSF